MKKNMAKLTIEVSAEELDKAMQNAYLKARGKISIRDSVKAKPEKNDRADVRKRNFP